MQRFRRIGAAVTCAVAVLAGALTTATAAPPAPSAPIAPAVLAGDGERDFWVRLEATADTSPAVALNNRTARGQRVVDTLQSTATGSQAALRQLLDARGVRYEAFWVTNAVKVSGGSPELARELARLDGVAEIRAPIRITAAEPVSRTAASAAPNGLEWGIANVRAAEVWAQHGSTGEGVVVANIDTGVEFDHPALVRQYRGTNGDGTFDHNYNWFDAQGICPDAPCDGHGHGTHTMGTMAGDDGMGNQIGVAPGVRWIAANGCCPSDTALLESSQWMLAPTDLTGQNPDVSRRPHIVNNSWGTEVPTNEPFLEDVQQAWADSGIFGVWANGNNGSACNTSGSPGSRTLNYSVGAYDEANTIAPFSSRGPGQDGEVKPNISAPGVNVRSAVPGGYSLMSGTSMATPHVAGAIALLWSANPTLLRDITATRALLDTTATDTPDDQCGGTPEDNNVYGEGRLDALALVNTGSSGVGTLAGTVTAADTGQPVPNTTVSVTGPIDREVRAGADGAYSMRLVPGQYQVSTRGVFGYQDHLATVEVTAEATTAHDVALVPRVPVPVTGTVTDGSGHGWGLPATVTATHPDGHTVTADTDPASGQYRLSVVPGAYRLRFTSPGYDPAERQIEAVDTELTVDVELTVTLACDAPGYRAVLTGRTEAFERRSPAGWQVTNRDPGLPGYDHTPGWTFTDQGQRPNATGGTGRFAIVDSDSSGRHNLQDTLLTGPVFTLTGTGDPVLRFGTDLNPAVNSTATAEVSADGGRTWTTVWRQAGHPGVRGPSTQVVALPQAADRDSIRVRFHYTGQWSGWWQVDDVFLGRQVCTAIPR